MAAIRMYSPIPTTAKQDLDLLCVRHVFAIFPPCYLFFLVSLNREISYGVYLLILLCPSIHPSIHPAGQPPIHPTNRPPDRVASLFSSYSAHLLHSLISLRLLRVISGKTIEAAAVVTGRISGKDPRPRSFVVFVLLHCNSSPYLARLAPLR